MRSSTSSSEPVDDGLAAQGALAVEPTTPGMRFRTVGRCLGRAVPLIVAALALVFAAGEAYFRLPGAPRRLEYDPDPELGAVVAPNQYASTWLANMSMRTPPISVNADGCRGRVTDWSRPVVLAVGDSQWFGVGVEDDEVWSVVLEGRLRRALNEPALQLVNAAQPGQGPEQQDVVLRRIVAAHRVRLVLVRVTVGQGNFHLLRGEAAREDYERTQWRKTVRGLTAFGPFLLDKIRAQQASLGGAFVPHFLRQSAVPANDEEAGVRMWTSAQEAWRDMVARAGAQGAPLVFVVDNVDRLAANDWLAERLRQEFADTPTVHVLRLGPEDVGLGGVPSAELPKVVAETLTLGRDPHYNAAMHRRMAEGIWAGLCAQHIVREATASAPAAGR